IYKVTQRELLPPLLLLAIMLLTVLMTAACFTFVIQRPFCLWIALLCLFTIVYYTLTACENSPKKLYLSILMFVFFSFVGLFYGSSIIRYPYVKSWNQATWTLKAGFFLEAMTDFERAAGGIGNHGAFWEQYGDALMRQHLYEQAAIAYEQAKNHRTSNRLYMNLGKCYARLGRDSDAAYFLEKAIYMVPNRFETRFALLEFYHDLERWEEARYWAETIVSLPIKVPSARVDWIITTTKERLIELKEK